MSLFHTLSFAMSMSLASKLEFHSFYQSLKCIFNAEIYSTITFATDYGIVEIQQKLKNFFEICYIQTTYIIVTLPSRCTAFLKLKNSVIALS